MSTGRNLDLDLPVDARHAMHAMQRQLLISFLLLEMGDFEVFQSLPESSGVSLSKTLECLAT